MKLDAIDSAINLAKEKATLTNLANKSTELIKMPISADKLTSVSKIKNLPIEKNPELIKKQLEAEFLTKKAEVQEYTLFVKDEAIETAKDTLAQLKTLKVPSLPKLPVIDVKTLQAVVIAKQLKELYKQKNKFGKENLKKGIDAYKFPLRAAELPSIKIPDIPFGKVRLPRTIPKLPKLSIPTLPNIPSLSSLTSGLPNLSTLTSTLPTLPSVSSITNNLPTSVSNITSRLPNFPNSLG